MRRINKGIELKYTFLESSIYCLLTCSKEIVESINEFIYAYNQPCTFMFKNYIIKSKQEDTYTCNCGTLVFCKSFNPCQIQGEEVFIFI